LKPLDQDDMPVMLDLLSGWQSLFALLSPEQRRVVQSLNDRTVALLNREAR
jgi:hypothetical protein